MEIFIAMLGLIHTIFENLEINNLNKEETLECLYYVDYLLENEESPENFFKYQIYKLKLSDWLKELVKLETTGDWLNSIETNAAYGSGLNLNKEAS